MAIINISHRLRLIGRWICISCFVLYFFKIFIIFFCVCVLNTGFFPSKENSVWGGCLYFTVILFGTPWKQHEYLKIIWTRNQKQAFKSFRDSLFLVWNTCPGCDGQERSDTPVNIHFGLWHLQRSRWSSDFRRASCHV